MAKGITLEKITLSNFFLSMLSTFFIIIGCGDDGWDGKTWIENGVRIIENPEQSLWSSNKIELFQNLVLGNESDPHQSFFRIKSVEISTGGRIYILDAGNFRIVVFDKNGTYLFEFGNVGSGPGEFKNPWDMALDSAGNIYVTDITLRRIVKFDSSGRHLTSTPDIYAHRIDAFLENVLLLTEMRFSSFGAFGQVLNLANRRVKFKIELPFTFDPSVTSGGISLEEKYQFLQDGKIYLAVPFPYKIRRYTSSGELEMQIIKEDSRISPPDIKIGVGFRSIKENGTAGPCFLSSKGFLLNNCDWITTEHGRTVFKTAIDFFNSQGQYLSSVELPNSQKLVAIDQFDNLYLLEPEPFETVIRARWELEE